MKNIDFKLLSVVDNQSQVNRPTSSGIHQSDEVGVDELDNHFMQKLNEKLDEIREHFGESDSSHTKQYIDNSHRENDSPLTMSILSDDENTEYTMEYCASELLSCDNKSSSENIRPITLVPRSNVMLLSEDKLSCTGNNPSTNVIQYFIDVSNVVDILNIYCRSQKYMYEQANILTQYQHNTIYGITISITSSICIVISFMETPWKNIIIILLNAIVSILIVMAKYLKLEISAELYLYISKQFDFIYNMSNAIQSSISNYKYDVHRNIIIIEKIKELEDRITETRDIPNITIPQMIQTLYPIAANLNIFAFIKRVDKKKRIISEELQKTNRELQYIAKKYNNNMGTRESQRFHYLLDIKKTLKKEQTHVKSAFSYMEELITLELNKADFYRYNCMRIYFPTNTEFSINHSHCNPFVDKYIRFIIPKYKKNPE